MQEHRFRKLYCSEEISSKPKMFDNMFTCLLKLIYSDIIYLPANECIMKLHSVMNKDDCRMNNDKKKKE